MRIVLLILCLQIPANAEKPLLGSWRWTKVSGGILGLTRTAEETGIHRRIEFSQDHVVSFYTATVSGDSLTFRNNFFIQTEQTIFSTQPLPVLHIQGMNKKQIIEWTSNDTLLLKENAADGLVYQYARIR